MIFFSIIIPNYNHEAFLLQRIQTVLDQTYSNFEVIILDDCSTDNSRKIIEAYRDHDKISHVIHNERNSGSPFKQWVKGIEIAKGDWIWIAESDDFADASFLQAAATSIIQNPSIGIFYTDAFIIKNTSSSTFENYSKKRNDFFNTTKWNTSYFNKGTDELNQFLKYCCTINNVSSMTFKKHIALPLLNDLKKFTFHGDWYFYIRLSLISNIYYFNKPLNYYRDNKESHLNSGIKIIKSKTELFYILNFLYSLPLLIEKDKMVNFFSFWYLCFGILKDGPLKGATIIKKYWKYNRKIALKVFINFFRIKLLRKKAPLFNPI